MSRSSFALISFVYLLNHKQRSSCVPGNFIRSAGSLCGDWKVTTEYETGLYLT